MADSFGGELQFARHNFIAHLHRFAQIRHHRFYAHQAFCGGIFRIKEIGLHIVETDVVTKVKDGAIELQLNDMFQLRTMIPLIALTTLLFDHRGEIETQQV